MAEVVLDNVVKSFGDVYAVDHVSLTIDDGEFIALVGPSACGKTTTRGGGNTTGVSFLFSDLVSKHLGLLRELLPRAARIGLLVNPQNANADHLAKNATAAAASTGTEITVLRASDTGAIEEAFATLTRQRADALMVGADGYFFRRRVRHAGGSPRSPYRLHHA